MQWRSGRRSDNVEDRRGMSVGKGVAGGGLGMIVIVVAALLFGIDPSTLLQLLGTSQPETTQVSPTPQRAARPAAENEVADFVAVVLGDTEDTWKELFQQMGQTYQEPKLVLFTDAVRSACGMAQSAVGPFYCPADQKVYIDLGFYRDLKERFQAPGDFAQAYVIAHEIGHHVQNLLGISDQVHALRAKVSEADANKLSVRQELQADCLAGVWAYHANQARKIIEEGDIAEALNAASKIGDDRLQMQSRGYVAPDSFTHGSSEQRMRWFTAGIESGKISACDTFKARQL